MQKCFRAIFSCKHGSAAISLFCGLTVFLLSLNMLATVAQSGDGAEFVLLSQSGGVPHPPGFPLQAWINLMFQKLYIGTPAWRLSLLSLLAHSGTVIALAETMRQMRLKAISICCASFAYAFFPPIWYLGVQPEVFALSYLLMALLQWKCSRTNFAKIDDTQGRKRITTASILFGLATIQHPICLITSPYLVSQLFTRSHSFLSVLKNTVLSATIVGTITSLGYLSLHLLNSQAGWPNWGQLDSISALISHITRAEFGIFSLGAVPNGLSQNALTVTGTQLLDTWSATLIFPLLGLFHILKQVSKASVFEKSIILTLLFSTIFLLVSNLSPSFLTPAYLERFSGTLLLSLTILFGIGLNRLLEETPPSLWGHYFKTAVAVTLIVLWFFSGKDQANASRDTTLEVLREGLAISVPPNSVYIGSTDDDTFYGLKTRNGDIRFPVARMTEAPWYVKKILPSLEPRLAALKNSAAPIEDYVATAISNGLEVAAINPMLLNVSDMQSKTKRRARLEGLVFVTGNGVKEDFNKNTLNRALELCATVSKLQPLPSNGMIFGRYRFWLFSRAYEGAANYLKTRNTAAAIIAENLAISLRKAQNASEWIEGCKSLTLSQQN